MLGSVFGKTLWDGRRGLLGWSAALAAITIMYAAFYPTMQDEAMVRALEAYPQELLQAFGWEDMASPAGYLDSTVFGLLAPILLIIFAINLGARAVAGHEEDGTLDLLLAQPMARGRVVLERAAAMTVVMLVSASVVFLALLIVRGPAAITSIPVGNLAAASLQVGLLGLVFGGIALAAGAWSGRRGAAISAAAVVAVLGYFANTIVRQIEAAAWLRHLSPFRYASGSEALRGGLQLGDALVLTAATVVLVALAVVALERRDVAV